MIKHIFLDKSCTITKDSDYNTGFNPIVELCTGSETSRFLVNFNIDEIRQLFDNSLITDKDKVKITLNMKNCGSINLPDYNSKVHTNDCKGKERASSFDIIAFKVPKAWDSGRGFNYESDVVFEKHRYSTKNGCSWFKAQNGLLWDEEGIYSNTNLAHDLFDNFSSEEKGIIIARQHFDYGIENMEIDITDYILSFMDNNQEFYGIAFAFAPRFEETTEDKQYIGFFGPHTNTFFNPYIEISYDEEINDDRAKFVIGKTNKLYFFVTDNGFAVNLDKLPKCSIDGNEYEVYQATKGVYYAVIEPDKYEMESNTIYYDIWSEIAYNGQEQEDVEMEFETLPKERSLSFGKPKEEFVDIIPSLYGIGDSEKINIGDVRTVFIDFRKKFSKNEKQIYDSCEYRLYVKENTREIDVFKYQPVETRFTSNQFDIDTNDLIPNDYHIDVKLMKGNETRYFKNVLEFTITDNITNYYL